jgi:hypothetical protein
MAPRGFLLLPRIKGLFALITQSLIPRFNVPRLLSILILRCAFSGQAFCRRQGNARSN